MKWPVKREQRQLESVSKKKLESHQFKYCTIEYYYILISPYNKIYIQIELLKISM